MNLFKNKKGLVPLIPFGIFIILGVIAILIFLFGGVGLISSIKLLFFTDYTNLIILFGIITVLIVITKKR